MSMVTTAQNITIADSLYQLAKDEGYFDLSTYFMNGLFASDLNFNGCLGFFRAAVSSRYVEYQ